ncbi:hypothetical protein MRS44_018522 [Fusarium solani]|uniref:uncharacterized protein n=1 Tax=Fusarium solani TaxID=169388 RepID=UPI0032C45D50|nr:hypothetical protein MRS44_018522 [Fusarium solani]
MAESLDKHERDRDRSPPSPLDGPNGNGSATLSARPDLGNPVLKSGTTTSLSEPDRCLSLDTRNGGAYRPSSTTRKPTQLSNCDADDEYFIAQSTNEREDDCDDMCPTNPPNSPVLSLDTCSMRRCLHYEATINPGLDLLEGWSLSSTGYERKDGMQHVWTIRMRYYLALDPGCDSAGASDRVDVPEADSEPRCWDYADIRVSLPQLPRRMLFGTELLRWTGYGEGSTLAHTLHGAGAWLLVAGRYED